MKIEWKDNALYVDDKFITLIVDDGKSYSYKMPDPDINGWSNSNYYTIDDVKRNIEDKALLSYMETLKPGYVKMIRRYTSYIDWYYDGVERCDKVWIDRISGDEVLRYDLSDPANTSSAYGAISDDEVFMRKNRDINEMVPKDQTKEI